MPSQQSSRKSATLLEPVIVDTYPEEEVFGGRVTELVLEDALTDSPRTRALRDKILMSDTLGSSTFTPKERKYQVLPIQKQKKFDTPWYRKKLNPHGTFRKFWDVAVVLALLYSALSVPFRLGFDLPATHGSSLVWELFVDGLFWLDIIFTFRTYLIIDGEKIKSSRIIAQKYMRFWFWLDFLAVFPFAFVIQTEDDGSNSARYFKLFRLFRMIRLTRLSHLSRISKKWSARIYINRGVGRSIKFGLILSFVGHILASFWFFAASIFDYGPETWVHQYAARDMSSHPAEWKCARSLENSTAVEPTARLFCQQYLQRCLAACSLDCDCDPSTDAAPRWNWYFASLYWAMTTITTVGYGGITAYNDVERAISMIGMLVGAASYGYIVGNMALLVQQYDPLGKKLDDKVEGVDAYMRMRNFDPHLRLRIRDFFGQNWAHIFGLLDQDMMLQELPQRLRNEVMVHLLRSFPFFASQEQRLLENLAQRMQTRRVTPDGTLCREGSIGKHMFFLVKGVVAIIKYKKVVRILARQSFFGEIALLRQPAVRSATALALELCEVCTLDEEGMHYLMSEAYRLYLIIHKVAVTRLYTEWSAVELESMKDAPDVYAPSVSAVMNPQPWAGAPLSPSVAATPSTTYALSPTAVIRLSATAEDDESPPSTIPPQSHTERVRTRHTHIEERIEHSDPQEMDEMLTRVEQLRRQNEEIFGTIQHLSSLVQS